MPTTSTKLTRLQLRTLVRNELLDPNARWWSDDELNSYLDDWQNELQTQFAFVESTSTLTLTTSTLTHTSLWPDAYKVNALYWNGARLPVRSIRDMNDLDANWRTEPSSRPRVAITFTANQTLLHPAPSSAGQLICEYHKNLSFDSDVTVMEVPAWTRYSAIPYCAYRAHLRFGPNQNQPIALRYKSQWLRALTYCRLIWDSYFPQHAPVLRPEPTRYEANILNPRLLGDVTVPVIISINLIDEVPTGTVDGLNSVFTLSHTPNPTLSLKLFVGGILYTQNTHYTLTGSTIVFVNPYHPQVGQSVFASYMYTN